MHRNFIVSGFAGFKNRRLLVLRVYEIFLTSNEFLILNKVNQTIYKITNKKKQYRNRNN